MKKEHKIIEVIFKTHYRELCYLSYQYVRNKMEAEDIVQDVFVKIITRKTIIAIDNYEHYLFKAVRNASLKRAKKMNLLRPITDTERQIMTSEKEEILSLREKVFLYKQIERLPKKCRNIFLSYVIDDLKYQQIAEKYGISVNTVKSQMKKAYRILRNALKNFYLLIPFLFLMACDRYRKKFLNDKRKIANKSFTP